MDILDLKNLNSEQTVFYNKISYDIRDKFIEAIDSLYKVNKDNLNWCFSSLASKDLYLTDIFIESVNFVFIIESFKLDPKINRVIVYNLGLARTLEKWKKQKNEIKVDIVSIDNRVTRWIKKMKAFCYLLLETVFGSLISIFHKPSNQYPNNNKLNVLLDSFIADYNSSPFNYNDRWFTGINNFLPENVNLYYLPTLNIKPWRKWKVVKEFKKDYRFILKEQYITVFDYFKSFAKTIFYSIELENIQLNGYDISDLCKYEHFYSKWNLSSFHSWSNYAFAKRLKNRNFKLHQLIDWNENQLIDKSLTKGIHDFFVNAKVIAYRGYIISNQFIHIIPTKEEHRLRLTADKYAVIGKGLEKELLEFDPFLNVITAPAFRFSHVHKERVSFPNDGLQIALALPIDLDLSVQLIKDLFEIADRLPVGTRFIIKNHPNNSQKIIQQLIGKWDNRFSFSKYDLNRTLEESHILVTTMSTSAMEAISKGVMTIIKCYNSKLFVIPIPQGLNTSMWDFCLSNEKLGELIINKIQIPKKEIEKEIEEITKNFFCKINSITVQEFFN